MAPKKRSLQEKLARGAALRAAPPEDAERELRAHLADRSGMVVALAATIVRERGLGALAKELEAAFFRLLEDPVGTDPGCRGKLAIADALRELDVHAVDVFVSGVGFRQLEPSFGRPSDTAGALRVCCAQGLLQVLHPRALFEIAPLLADAEPNVRAGIASVLGGLGSDAAEALLRLKATLGDREPDVTGACLAGLLRSSFERNFPFVRAALEDADAGVLQVALVAMGESREAAAMDLLTGYAESSANADVRSAALTGLALLRRPEATAYLVARVEQASEVRAAEAVSALGALRWDGELAARVGALAAARGAKVSVAFARAFRTV